MGTDYWELDGSPVETWDLLDGLTATRQVGCLWVDRYDVMAMFLAGLGVIYEHHGGGVLRARGGTIKPAAGETQSAGTTMCAYEHADIEVRYVVPDVHKTAAGDLFTESLEPAIEFLTLDHLLFEWADGKPLTPEEAPGKPFHSVDYVLTKYGVATVPGATFDMIGKVNNANLTSYLLGVTFPAETLLYNPPVLNRKVDTSMTTAGWNITYRFSYRPDGWNKFWRADTQAWEAMKLKGGGDYKNFETGDFELLRA